MENIILKCVIIFLCFFFVYFTAQNLVDTEMEEGIEDILLHHTTASTATQDPALDLILPVSTGTTDGLLDFLLSMH